MWEVLSQSRSKIEGFKAITPTKLPLRTLPGLMSQMRTSQYVWKPLRGILPLCSLLGRSLPCTFAEWSSHPMLTPGQKPTENRRTKSCPGVGQCTEVRAWKPGKYPVIKMHPGLLTSTKSAVAMHPSKQATISFPIIYVPTMNTETRWDSFQYSLYSCSIKETLLSVKTVYYQMIIGRQLLLEWLIIVSTGGYKPAKRSSTHGETSVVSGLSHCHYEFRFLQTLGIRRLKYC